jgi:hypothetical protein
VRETKRLAPPPPTASARRCPSAPSAPDPPSSGATVGDRNPYLCCRPAAAAETCPYTPPPPAHRTCSRASPAARSSAVANDSNREISLDSGSRSTLSSRSSLVSGGGPPPLTGWKGRRAATRLSAAGIRLHHRTRAERGGLGREHGDGAEWWTGDLGGRAGGGATPREKRTREIASWSCSSKMTSGRPGMMSRIQRRVN